MTFFPASNAAFDYTDHCGMGFIDDLNPLGSPIIATGAAARFTRPVYTGTAFPGQEYLTPGCRVRFNCSDATVKFYLRRAVRMWQEGVPSDVTVYVNGTYHSVVSSSGLCSVQENTLSFGSSTSRLIELVLPCYSSADFLGVDASSISSPTARGGTDVVVMSDSIGLGGSAMNSRNTWVNKVALARNWNLHNMSYGGAYSLASFGTVCGDVAIANNADAAVIVMGTNDFGRQTTITQFNTDYGGALFNLRGKMNTYNVNAPIYMVTPFWRSGEASLPITLEQYRQQIRNLKNFWTAQGWTNLVLVEGKALATNSLTSFPDGIHPNDFGHDEVATNIAPSMP